VSLKRLARISSESERARRTERAVLPVRRSDEPRTKAALRLEFRPFSVALAALRDHPPKRAKLESEEKPKQIALRRRVTVWLLLLDSTLPRTLLP
jgi:hypothetical protein